MDAQTEMAGENLDVLVGAIVARLLANNREQNIEAQDEYDFARWDT